MTERVRYAGSRVRDCGARRRSLRPAFTLVEVMVAMTLLAMAGSTLLIGMASTTTAAQDVVDRAIAEGMAEQLLDEILGMRYMEYGGSAYDAPPLGPGGSEAAAGARKQFDDIDDYNRIRTSPPTDRWGVALGNDDGRQATRPQEFRAPSGYFAGWTQQVDVQYVAESDLATPLSSGTSNYRLITVRITVDYGSGATEELAKVSRVVAYVPGS